MVEGQDIGSGVCQKWRPQQAYANRFYCTAADNFQHTQNTDDDELMLNVLRCQLTY